MDFSTWLNQKNGKTQPVVTAVPQQSAFETWRSQSVVPKGPMSVPPLGGETISTDNSKNLYNSPLFKILPKSLREGLFGTGIEYSPEASDKGLLGFMMPFLTRSQQTQYDVRREQGISPDVAVRDITGSKQGSLTSTEKRKLFVQNLGESFGKALDVPVFGAIGGMKNVAKELSTEAYTKLIRLVDRSEIQTTLRPLGLTDDAERELADAIRLINTETKLQAGARKIEIQNIVDDVLRKKYAIESGPTKSVVQVVRKNGDNVFYEVSPEDLKVLSEDVIDGTGRGIAGKTIDGNIYHLTAKTPTQMIENAGFKNGGKKTLDEILQMITPKKRVPIRGEDGKFLGSFIDDTPAFKVATKQTADEYATILERKAVRGEGEFDLTIPEAKQTFNNLFDQKEVGFIIRDEIKEGKQFGNFSRQFKSLVEVVQKNGKVQSDTLHHEAFHAYFNTFMTAEERQAILTRLKMSPATAIQRGKKVFEGYKGANVRAEEWLADDFARYIREISAGQKPTSMFAEIWQKIVRHIRQMIRKANHIDQLYADIVARKRAHVEKPSRRPITREKNAPEVSKPEKEYDNILVQFSGAEKGERIGVQNADGTFGGFKAKSSTFPQWVPEDLRSRDLFDKYLDDHATGSLDDFKKEYTSDSRLARLDDAVRNRLFEKTGYDLRINPGDMQQLEETAKQLRSIQQSLQSEKPQLRYRQNSTSPLPDDIPEEDAVKKITEMIKKAKPLQRKQDKLYSEERGRRVAAMVKVGEEVGGEQGYFAQLATQKGMLPRVDFEAVKSQVSQKNIDSLFDRVEQSRILSPFEKLATKTGLAKILGGTLPTRSETKLLSEVFPKEFIDAVMDKRPWAQKFMEGFAQVINIPRAIMATADLSAALRQGVFLIGRPKQFAPAFRDMFKYAFSEKAYVDVMERIQARPTYKYMREGGLSLTDMGKFVDNREEQFMSDLVEKIPVLGQISRGSNRAYTGFLNQLRADVFDDIWKSAKQLGIDKERPDVVKDIAKFVNSATGRGDLGMFNRAAPILNGIFFSPRLLASRINLLNPVYYARLDPFVRKEALKSLVTFASIMGTVITFAKLNGADVETDPRNADFGKLKFDNTRYDVLGGFQQYIRLASQLISGKIISSTTGKEITLGEGYKSLTRLDVLMRFFQNKEAPVLSFATALMNGQNSMGDKTDIPTEIVNRSIPLVVQDMYDLYQEWGPQGIAMGLPAILGVGSQTYGGYELVKGKNKIGQDTAQLKATKGLGEKIAEMFGSKPDLSSTPAYAVSSFVDELKALPKNEAADSFDEIKQANPKLAEKIVKELKDRELGITEHEKSIRAKGVESGDRAMAIAEELDALDTKEEKAQLWDDYTKKKLITKDVAEQLKLLLSGPN